MIHEPCVVSLAFYNEILAFLQHNIRMFPTRDSRLCNANSRFSRARGVGRYVISLLPCHSVIDGAAIRLQVSGYGNKLNYSSIVGG